MPLHAWKHSLIALYIVLKFLIVLAILYKINKQLQLSMFYINTSMTEIAVNVINTYNYYSYNYACIACHFIEIYRYTIRHIQPYLLAISQ